MDLSVSKKLLLVFLSFLMYSCNDNKPLRDENLIEYKTEAFISTYIDVDNPQNIKNMIINGENVFLYIYSSSCSACKEYESLINNFISFNEAVVYSIDARNFPSLGRDEIFSYMVTPTMCLYSKGKIVTKINPNLNNEAFSSSEGMKKYFEQFGFFSYRRKIKNENDLDKVINLDNALIYFSYDKCSDCSFFDYNYLNKYFALNCSKVIYNFEMSYYFDNRENSSSPIYKNFTDKYGLSYDGNNKFGYKNGVVPTLQKYIKGKLDSSIIIFNDEVTYFYDENQEIEKVKIISSYYQNYPYLNQEFYRDNNGAMNNYRTSTLSFFVDKFNNMVEK